MKSFLLVLLLLSVTNALDTKAILNGRGFEILQYVNSSVNADDLYTSYSRCETSCTSEVKPCARISPNPLYDECVAPSIYYDWTNNNNNGIPIKNSFCPPSYVCCSATCRPTVVKTCEYAPESSNDVLSLPSIISLIETIGAPSLVDAVSLLSHLDSDEVMNARCLSNCNGWDTETQGAVNVTTENCSPTACHCESHSQPKIIPGPSTFVCQKQVMLGDGGLRFSSGNDILSQNLLRSADDDEVRVVCPADYDCTDSTKCMSFDQYTELYGVNEKEDTNTEEEEGKEGEGDDDSTDLIVGIVAGVVGFVVLIIIIVMLVRKYKQHREEEEEDEFHYQAMTNNAEVATSSSAPGAKRPSVTASNSYSF